jgi:hypothetical protein
MSDVEQYEVLVLGSGGAGTCLAWTMAKAGHRTRDGTLSQARRAIPLARPPHGPARQFGGAARRVVVLAFSADPVVRWTWPDAQQYLRHFPRFVQAFGGKAFAHGSAYYVDGYAGTALWLSPGVPLTKTC